MARPLSPPDDGATIDPSSATLAESSRREPVDPSGVTIASVPVGPQPTRRAGHGVVVRVTDAPPSAERDPLIGRTLRHFRVDAPLGKGGMGAVYRAWDLSLERPVALKVLLHDSPGARARFVREARAQARLRHPHVVPIHYVDEAGDVAFFVMDLVEGESLASALDRGPLPPDQALDVADFVAQALEAGHAQGLVHRDVKPSNILVERGGRILLADFGLAKDVGSHGPDPSAGGALLPQPGDAALTRVGSIVGTPAYLSPEQAEGLPVDFRADIYALGVTLYEAVAGQPPFTAPSFSGLLEQHKAQEAVPLCSLVPSVHPALDALVARMMQKSPERRYASYPDLRAAIASARIRRAIPAPPVPRGIAFFIDVCIFGFSAALATAVSGWLSWPVLGLVLGVVEGQWGRTPGKKWLRLCAVGPFDARIGFPRAILRNEVKLWGPMLVTWLELAHVPGRLSALSWLVVLGWTVDLFIGAFSGSRRALHDRVAGARVVVALEEASFVAVGDASRSPSLAGPAPRLPAPPSPLAAPASPGRGTASPARRP